jgi:hypothetical protein
MTTQQHQPGRYVYCQPCRRHVLRAGYAAHYKARHAAKPVGKTTFGVTLWPVPGRPGWHLAWGGPGDSVHLHSAAATLAVLGAQVGTVSHPARDVKAAQALVDAWLAGQCMCSCHAGRERPQHPDGCDPGTLAPGTPADVC